MDPNLQKLQEQSLKMQQQLQQEEVVSEIAGVKIVMRGDQYVRSVSFNGQEYPQLVEVINDAIRKTQELAARKLIALQQS
ncbi:MAG TPA: YbaB/EbfC family nucleoid-associated protein [Candidatus Saccharimonadales bacterium]|nr:YbaB/EbfC family nucleoid-associated protein [Candidatus Saccharimonadales bacterium]